MFFKYLILFLCLFFLFLNFADSNDLNFTYHSFKGANNTITLDGIAEIEQTGLLRLTNASVQKIGHAFYSHPIPFKNKTTNESLSFSTTFVFGIVRHNSKVGGHGLAFVLAPQRGLPGALPSTYLGLFNLTSNGNASNHVVAIELDTLINPDFSDINDNHVGIDINDLVSVKAAPASYFPNDGGFKNVSLVGGKPLQLWVEYDGVGKQLNVTIVPAGFEKPIKPLLSLSRDLSDIFLDDMYVGFSSSTGSLLTAHYVLGWSFQMNGKAQQLDLARLPKLPRNKGKINKGAIITGVSTAALVLISGMIFTVIFIIRRRRKFAEVLEDWELEYGPHRFKYKDLYIATNGFKDKELLGIGGFGRVYRGILPTSKIEVAVKRVSHESRQGMKEFVSEIVSMGRLRHRNLVQLMGYCRRKGELLLVYDFMPNGSLDKLLFDHPELVLTWNQRFQVIKGVASGLLYLHEGWEQVVIHRDVKASNVLLDGEFNARLGDFGLARLYDHGTDPQTTHVVGTVGYLAPELNRTGKATRSTDVFAFGAFMLEVACGRRPIEPQSSAEALILVDWVFLCWSRGMILQTVDPDMERDYAVEEMEMVLKLGLLCSHYVPATRPSMRQVVQILAGDIVLPELGSTGISEGFENAGVRSDVSSPYKAFSLVADSILSQGR